MKFGSVLPLLVAYLTLPSLEADRLEMKSNALTEVSREGYFHRNSIIHRIRRSAPTAEEIQEYLNAHNNFRRLESSSNMEVMKWNTVLASMANDWAENCSWEHGQPPRDPKTVPYNTLGQNLYAISGGKINLTSAVELWYDEKANYEYSNNTCKPNQVCGHYTQVVWGTSREIGCAYAFCTTLRKLNFYNSIIMVCNYGPPGNYFGEKPYAKGTACSACESGSSWCDNGLCNRHCTSSGPSCACAMNCLNCGKPNTANCSCSCASGWRGADCSQKCINSDSRCDPPPGTSGWPPSWCYHTTMGDTVRQKCPVMCKLCQAGSSSASCTSTSRNPSTTKTTSTSINPTTTKTTSTSRNPSTTKTTSTSINPTTTKTTSTSRNPTTTKTTSTSINPTTTKTTSTSRNPTTIKTTSTSRNPTTTKTTSTSRNPTTTKTTSTSRNPTTTKTTSTSRKPTPTKARLT